MSQKSGQGYSCRALKFEQPDTVRIPITFLFCALHDPNSIDL